MRLASWTEQSKSLSPDFRRISPPVIKTEATYIDSKTRKLDVFFNEKGEVTLTSPIKPGKILVRNINTQIHIMQPKHNWDKLIDLTGNIEEDCKKVIKLMEDNQIFLEKYRLERGRHYKNSIRYDHQMTINGFEVKANFNKNLVSEEIFLNDAWVTIE